MRIVLAAVVSLALLAGCAAHTHQVGRGGPTFHREEVKQKEVYLLDLVPLVNVDSKEMAAGAKDYTIRTEQSFVDVLLSRLSLGILTVRTVKVATKARGPERVERPKSSGTMSEKEEAAPEEP